MKAFLRAGLAAGTMFAGLAPAIAHAGGSSSSSNCHCTTPPPPCDCNVPTSHNVWVPGVNITPPTVVVNAPSIYVAAPNVEVQSASVAYAQSSAQASSSAQADSQANANGQAAVYSNASALAAANTFASGGGSSYAVSEGANSYIPNLQVEGIGTAESRRICAEFRAVAKVVAVQAVCLDDKAIPHPASQVMPDRDVLPTYEGEVFRCIAGSRMQYTLAEYAGSADFGRGQTVSCQKGEALYHTAGGLLACRPQRPARDCNERSLLRRYGAGIKVLKLDVARQCVAYKTETAQTSTPGSLLLDGGVGGIVH